MRFLFAFSILASAFGIPLLDRFDNWAAQFRIQFQSKHHLYDTLRKWMTNDEYIDRMNQENKPYQL
jgi:hypothetical protein